MIQQGRNLSKSATLAPPGPGTRLATCAVVALSLALPRSLPAWEESAERLVINNAVQTVPYPLRSFLDSNRTTLLQLAANPAQWGNQPFDPNNGFIRLDDYGRYPFAELPRDYNAAVRKFRRTKVVRNGTLPWQIGTYSLKLEEAFRAQRWDEVKLYASILAHYVAEANDPFNTTLNFNGELSGQPGVNSRYGASLVDRFQMFFLIRPGGAYKIGDATQHAFGMLLEANTWVDNILFADSQARSGKLDYNDEYYDAFYEGAGPILIRQLTSASQNVGAYWYTAWVNAGRPALPVP